MYVLLKKQDINGNTVATIYQKLILRTVEFNFPPPHNI